MSSKRSQIIVQEVSKHYKKQGGLVEALSDLSFTVEEGEILGLLGANGAGKSTLVRILSTLLASDSGTVNVNGHDASDDPVGVRRSIGVALQDVGLDDSREVRRMVLTHARLHGLGRRESARRVEELLADLGLEGVAEWRVGNLSGGIRRKVDLALALVHRPPVILLDEPTVGLDPPSRIKLWRQIQALQASGTTVLLTTQHLEEADYLADRLLILSQGKAVMEGSPIQLKRMIGGSTLRLGFKEAIEAERGVACLGKAAKRLGKQVHNPISDPDGLRTALDHLYEEDLHPISVELREPNLDDLFLQSDWLKPEPRSQS